MLILALLAAGPLAPASTQPAAVSPVSVPAPTSAWSAQDANAALAEAGACIEKKHFGSGPMGAPCTALFSASEQRVRGNEQRIRDGMMLAEIELQQPDGSWVKLEEVDGSFHHFVWVEPAQAYLGYASWYGEYGSYMLHLPGSKTAFRTRGVPVFSQNGKLVVGAKLDLYGNGGVELSVHAVQGNKAAERFRTQYDPEVLLPPEPGQDSESPDAVRSLVFVNDDWIQMDLDVQGKRHTVWVSVKDGALRLTAPT